MRGNAPKFWRADTIRPYKTYQGSCDFVGRPALRPPPSNGVLLYVVRADVGIAPYNKTERLFCLNLLRLV